MLTIDRDPNDPTPAPPAPPPPPEDAAPSWDDTPEDGQPARKTKRDAAAAINILRPFIGRSQLLCMGDGCRGEEKQYFIDKFCEMADRVATMPKTYEQDGKGDEAIVHLHYFAGGQANWYITEKDKGDPRDATPGQQTQAFGLADLFRDGGELGYISIVELLSCGAELDLHFTPRTLGQLRKERNL